MTGCTLRSIATLMIILARMAGVAAAVELVFEVCSSVTVVAGKAVMPVKQRETSLLDVIESNLLPCLCAMTVLTVSTVLTCVNIINSVTAVACGRRFFKLVVPVTVDAQGRPMLACEWIACRRVIECRARPGCIAVTV